MRRLIIPAVLLLLLALAQAQLWLGRGSITDIHNQKGRLAVQQQANEKARQTNEQLEAEITDLRQGLEMVEERARQELGMVKPNEIFVQVAPKKEP
ncbi:MAG: Cell division protein FtsB [Paracidovorax wautersii]|uniref:Cell division protein FtsB n=1 Tax=Paracidovorax wautersii TaxID=1177982 RepID=A0A7V8FPF1_9BURK|nr:MAG: Cell division protein FtsB [Paracidovorax wautersii]